MDRHFKTTWLERDLVRHNSSDYFAVLGSPVTADSYQIRQRYLNLARTLHPDVPVRSLQSEDSEPHNKDKACEYLAKLVNPAYDSLMQARERAEYNALVKLIARRLMRGDLKLTPKSEAAQKLMRSPSTSHYVQSVEEIAKLQYNSLDKVLEYTDQLSELNLVYALYQEGYYPSISDLPDSIPQPDPNQVGLSVWHANTLSTHKPKKVSSHPGARSKMYIRSAEAYIHKKQWTMALCDLRAALQIDHTSSRCHALLGVVYLNQQLLGMAKVSFQRALKLNPKEPLALGHLNQYARMLRNASAKNQKGSGFFGWLGSS
jgi:tetratricopeptide (TPR) repeat protein